jgi:hypothetical protein
MIGVDPEQVLTVSKVILLRMGCAAKLALCPGSGNENREKVSELQAA